MNRIEMIFGSKSDYDLVMPGIVKATEDIKGLDVVVHWASADNTPEKAEKIAKMLESYSAERGIPFISGAGMSNVLTGTLKKYAGLHNLVIGVPIEDSDTDGLSSLLSTCHKPKLNPVLAVGINNSYAAVNIAARFINSEYEKVFVLGKNVAKELTELGIAYEVADGPIKKTIKPDDLVITVYDHYNTKNPQMGPRSDTLRDVDEVLRKGAGIQVGVREKGSITRYDYFMDCLDGTEATGIVSPGIYKNAVQIAAVIMRHDGALKKIDEEKKTKSDKLRKEPSLLVRDGEVEELAGHYSLSGK
jgi:phosphoribosylaminoimidazole carboxylase PurE protein